MNYRLWHIPGDGDGLLIALSAIVHVCIPPLAVGGGVYLALVKCKPSALLQKGSP